MPDTDTTEEDRRVVITLTFRTTTEPGVVLASVLHRLGEATRDLESTHANGFSLGESTNPFVQLVIDPAAGLLGVYVENSERAEEHARNVDGVVIELPVDIDHRAGTR